MTQQPNVIATWSDTGTIHLTDVSKQIAALEKGGTRYIVHDDLNIVDASTQVLLAM
jgi:hypothetical protein